VLPNCIVIFLALKKENEITEINKNKETGRTEKKGFK
jgi:hypothetical protein